MVEPIGVLGTGSYLPTRVVENAEVAVPAGVDAEWIERKTGIRSRRRAAPEQATSDLAARAADAALEAAGIEAADLSYLVVATSTPDQPQPATGCLVQHLIGARNAAAFDLNAVCSGFLFGLATAGRLLGGDGGGYGLVVGADIYSRILDPTDRRTAVLFGDGAGAVVLGPVPAGHGMLAVRMRSDGGSRGLIEVPGGGSRMPPSPAMLDAGAQYFRMIGREVKDYVSTHVPPLLREVMGASELAAEEVDHFVPHQANGLMLADLAGRAGLSEAIRTSVWDYGNTGAASVPITLDDTVRGAGVAPGETVLLAAFGGGMSMAAAMLRWSASARARRAA
ncbi:ketoacyl-ACP synthase III [Pseudonocardia eucalypti]|uniref:Ketoacyl-ACP synthase III n=1 Tax=Pseudonocardia eucalypti TaxID=648755 RepID=A0ABP9PXP5_9PSEU|nr:3-oxoacyl-[acyl-carrier-protein] synthase-3 [Pseudonocardia eucalypti]